MDECDDQAARWFAALHRGLMTQDERIAYDVWRRDPANVANLADLQPIWALLEPRGADLRATAGPDETRPGFRAAALSRTARVAAMLSAASIAVAVLSRLDSAWWTTLDWWSR